jgi:hypothetical protein
VQAKEGKMIKLDFNRAIIPAQNFSLFDFLSEELTLSIFSFLLIDSEKDLIKRIPLVSKRWYRLSADHSLWKPIFYKYFSWKFEKDLAWKEAFVTKRNWERGSFIEEINESMPDKIEKCQLASQRLLDVNILYNGNSQNKLEIWDYKKEEKLHSFSLLNPSQNVREDDSKFLYSYQQKIHETKWTINIRVLNFKQEFPPHRYVHLGYQPSLSFLNIYEDKVIAKINHLFLYISDLFKKNVRIIPLISNCEFRYQNLIYQEGAHLWVGDEGKLKVYDVHTSELKKELDIPDFESFQTDIALTSKKMIVVTATTVKCYEIGQQEIKEKWTIPINEGLKKKIIAPQDQCSYFGLYQSNLKILEVFDSEKGGKLLCSFKDFHFKKILLDAYSIRYLDKNNQLITRLFSPRLFYFQEE